MGTPFFWIGFNLFVLAMLALDLGVFNRETHVVKPKEALRWSLLSVVLALLFNAILYFWVGDEPVLRKQHALEFLTGYILELSLSVDNLFVMLVIFRYFRVKPEYQHRVLFWGILGALVMRGGMIVAGAALLERYQWLFYLFGGFLVFTGLKMLFSHEEPHPEKNIILRWFRRIMPMSHHYSEEKFFVFENGRKMATPLLAVLVLIEATDLVFATDSIPAIFGVTKDPFIVYTSNIFAILGLRSLYFLLAGIMDKFHHLKVGLAFVLMFIGLKMVLDEGVAGWQYHIPISISLGVVAAVLGISAVTSLAFPPGPESIPEPPLPPPGEELPAEVFQDDPPAA